MAKFYVPEVRIVRETPVIVYPCEGVEKLLSRDDPGSVSRHLEELYSRNNLLRNGEFNIDILWTDNLPMGKEDLMTDVWKYTQLDSWGSGALVDEQTYRGFVRDIESGTSAEFGLSMLGREAELRMLCLNLKVYLAMRPMLHPQTTNKQKFSHI